MTYLYAGLGIVMVAGIMAMAEMGLSLTGQQSQLTPPLDAYTGGTPEQRDDQRWLQLLQDSEALDAIGKDQRSQSLCDQLLCRVSETMSGRCKGENSIDPDFEALAGFSDTLINDPAHPFPGACVLSKGVHRVLIVPNEGNASEPYGLYSCLTNTRSSAGQCSFEG